MHECHVVCEVSEDHQHGVKTSCVALSVHAIGWKTLGLAEKHFCIFVNS